MKKEVLTTWMVMWKSYPYVSDEVEAASVLGIDVMRAKAKDWNSIELQIYW